MPIPSPTLGPLEDRGDAVLVVGAGPAGLAAARALRARGLSYDHVDRHGVGGIWDIEAPGSPMYEAAHFISSRTLSGFEGFPMPADYPDYPHHRQVLAYLRSFADAYDLTDRVETGVEVRDVDRSGDRWQVTLTDGRRREYAGIVCCSGAQWFPVLPDLPGEFAGELRHSNTYRSADEVRGRRVLVVGGGNSGCDIAVDAARTADRVLLSMRRGYWFIPKHVFGRPSDVFAAGGPHLPVRLQQKVFGWVLNLLNGRPERWGLQKPDHRLFETHPVLNSNLFLALQHGDVEPRPAIRSVDGHRVVFTDGQEAEVDTIIAATGYRHAVPYAQRFLGSDQHPDLYLTSFSRQYEGLFGIGFTETNSGAFKHFDALAQMIASHLDDRRNRPEQYRGFRQFIADDTPDLTGGLSFDSSARHQGYVDADALTRYRAAVGRRFGWRLQTGTRRDLAGVRS
ncbi:flavin-containing monooxygenase [Kineococcus sp. R86509]|uniref:flavin-containing monooxygenase n=1 Tax=Kineococcus sp. R86509 TaxID=3093851 RepID=UPI0036D36E6B